MTQNELLELNFIERDPDIIIGNLHSVVSNEFFMKYSCSFQKDRSKKLIDYFNEVRKKRYGAGGVLPSEYTSEYNKICEDWQRKIITIGIEDDLVIVVLKKIQMFKTVYVRIEGLPISITNNRDNEIKVLLELFKSNLVFKVGGLEKEMKELNKYGFEFSEKIDSFNFYSYIPTNYEKMTNRWRTKKGINRMLKMENLTWKVMNDYSEDIETINDGFDKWKREVEGVSKGWHKLSKAIKKYKFWEDKNVIYYMFSYKDIPVGLCVYITVNNIAHQIVNKSIGHSIYDREFNPLNEQETLELEEIKKRSNALIHYITIKDLNERGIEHGYFGGSFSMKSLRTYKRIMNDDEIEHSIYKLKESELN